MCTKARETFIPRPIFLDLEAHNNALRRINTYRLSEETIEDLIDSHSDAIPEIKAYTTVWTLARLSNESFSTSMHASKCTIESTNLIIQFWLCLGSDLCSVMATLYWSLQPCASSCTVVQGIPAIPLYTRGSLPRQRHLRGGNVARDESGWMTAKRTASQC